MNNKIYKYLTRFLFVYNKEDPYITKKNIRYSAIIVMVIMIASIIAFHIFPDSWQAWIDEKGTIYPKR